MEKEDVENPKCSKCGAIDALPVTDDLNLCQECYKQWVAVREDPQRMD